MVAQEVRKRIGQTASLEEAKSAELNMTKIKVRMIANEPFVVMGKFKQKIQWIEDEPYIIVCGHCPDDWRFGIDPCECDWKKLQVEHRILRRGINSPGKWRWKLKFLKIKWWDAVWDEEDN